MEVRGHSQPLQMAPFDRSHMTCYQSAIVKYISILYQFWDIWRWRISWLWIYGHSRCKQCKICSSL